MKKSSIYILILLLSVFNGIKVLSLTDLYGINESVVNNIGLAKPEFLYSYMTLLAFDMFPIILVQLVCGTYIYKHFFMATAYYFTRHGNKSKWFLNESGKLFFEIVSIISTYIISSTFIMIMLGTKIDNILSLIYIDISIIILFTLYTYIFTFIINVISIFVGSQIGFIVVFSIEMVFVIMLLIHEKIGFSNGIGNWLIKLNPISNIIISFHSTKFGFNTYIDKLDINFDIIYSILYLVSIALFCVFSALFTLKNIDLSIENREEIG